MLSNKNKRVCKSLNYTEHFFALVFVVTICVSISAFVSLIDISKRIMSSAIWSNIWARIARIKKYKSLIKKKKRKLYEIALLAETNLDYIKDFSRSLPDSYIEGNYLNLINLLRGYDYMKEEGDKLETK